MEKFIPDIYQKSIYDINYKKLKKKGIKCLLFDVDNTLVPYNEEVPSTDVKELFNLLSSDFKVILFSNSNKKRLTPFKEILNVDTAYSCMKPFSKKYKKVMRLYKLEPNEIACIGDQLITDILGANRQGCLSILVNNISPKEPLGTKINRFLEKPIYKKLSKKRILRRGEYFE